MKFRNFYSSNTCTLMLLFSVVNCILYVIIDVYQSIKLQKYKVFSFRKVEEENNNKIKQTKRKKTENKTN